MFKIKQQRDRNVSKRNGPPSPPPPLLTSHSEGGEEVVSHRRLQLLHHCFVGCLLPGAGRRYECIVRTYVYWVYCA